MANGKRLVSILHQNPFMEFLTKCHKSRHTWLLTSVFEPLSKKCFHDNLHIWLFLFCPLFQVHFQDNQVWLFRFSLFRGYILDDSIWLFLWQYLVSGLLSRWQYLIISNSFFCFETIHKMTIFDYFYHDLLYLGYTLDYHIWLFLPRFLYLHIWLFLSWSPV